MHGSSLVLHEKSADRTVPACDRAAFVAMKTQQVGQGAPDRLRLVVHEPARCEIFGRVVALVRKSNRVV